MTIRTAARPNIARQPVARMKTLPPSVGGINSIDAITDMPPMDALILDNFFCQPDYVELRRGYEQHATGMSGNIDSIMSWQGFTGDKLKAATSSAIYDVTSAGAVGAAEVSGLSNGQWQDVIMSNGGGTNFLVIANGADAIRNYDGSSWTTPSITGVSSANINNLAVHHRRLWMVEKDSTAGWYLGTDAIAGAATRFDFGPRFTLGGYLVAIGSMSRDGGDGPDDLLVAISSRGEIAVYSGTDPSSATTWASVGTFYTSPPVGKRCFEKTGGDLAVITTGGILSVSALMPLDRTAQKRAAVTNKINRFFTDDVRTYGSNFGWEVVGHPRNNMLIANVPTRDNSTYRQYVMNTITGGWSRFTNLNGSTFTSHDEDIYFGGTSGIVYKADTNFQDDGNPITADLKTAFHDWGQPGRRKAFGQLRPLYQSTGAPGFLMSLNVDFEDEAPTQTPTAAALLSTDIWGTALWGTGLWQAGSDVITKDWQGVANYGTYASIRMRVTSDGSSLKLFGFESIYESGGPQ